jgi:hypothetical protein
MMVADATVRVVRKARRRLEPAATETPGFSFVFPDAVVAQKVAGTGYRSLLEGRYRRMVKVDAAGRRREELVEREAMRCDLTEEGCLQRQADRVVRSIRSERIAVLAARRGKMGQIVWMIYAARAVAVLRQLWMNFRMCCGSKGWGARQAARELLRLAQEMKQRMARELVRVAEEKVSRKVQRVERLRRQRAAVAAMLAVRVKLVRRRWWKMRMQEVRLRLFEWRVRTETSAELVRAAMELGTRIAEWKLGISARREKFKIEMGERRQRRGVVEAAPSALCDVLRSVRLRRPRGVQEVQLHRWRRSSKEVWEHLIKSFGK